MSLPAGVAKEDHLLEEQEAKASTALMELRWHWTLDESNPDRISMREYAHEVGKAKSTIQGYANGYVLLMDSGRSGAATPSEARIRANMGAETEAVTEAVAEAHGISLGEANKTRNAEVKRIREWARDEAEKKGTSVVEEAPKVAKSIAKAQKAGERVKNESRQRRSLRYIEAEGDLAQAERKLRGVLSLAHEVEWDPEEIELLRDAIERVRHLLDLIDRRFADDTDVDWDAELAKIA